MKYIEFSYDIDHEEFLEQYDVLGVPRNSDLATCKKAYRQLTLKYHPDKNRNCVDCADKFMAVKDAWKMIQDFHKGKAKIINKPQEPPTTQQ